jgi:hypothetical protein
LLPHETSCKFNTATKPFDGPCDPSTHKTHTHTHTHTPHTHTHRERERERQRERKREREREREMCVWQEWEREREREMETETEQAAEMAIKALHMYLYSHNAGVSDVTEPIHSCTLLVPVHPGHPNNQTRIELVLSDSARVHNQ